MKSKDAQGALMTAGVVGAIGIGVVVVAGGLRDMFRAGKHTGEVVDDVTAAAARLSELVKQTSATLAAPFDTTKGANTAAPRTDEFSGSRSQLRLVVIDKKRSKTALNERIDVTLEARDAAGQSVPYAEFTGTPNTAMGRHLFGTIHRVADARGRVALYWTLRRALPGADNNITFVARKPGYNPSAAVTVG